MQLEANEAMRSIALERHYTIPQSAKLWAVSQKVVRKLFCEVAGVLEWDNAGKSKKRAYVNLRVPKSIMIRVHAEWSR